MASSQYKASSIVMVGDRSASYRILYVYLIKEVLFAFSVSLLFFYFIFFINHLLLLAEEILAKDVPIRSVLLLVFYATPNILVITFPFATLVGPLMAIGQLASGNEILIMRAAGLSRYRILNPLLLIGGLFVILSFAMNDYFLPLGAAKFQKLYKELLVANPRVKLTPFSVISFNNMTIVTGDVSKEGVEDLLIFDKDEQGRKRIILAERGVLQESQEKGGILSLLLKGVLTQSVEEREKGTYSYVTAKEMQYNLFLEDVPFFSTSLLIPANMRTYDVWQAVKRRKKNYQRETRELERDRARHGYRMVSAYLSLRESGGKRETFARIRRGFDAHRLWQEQENKTIYKSNLQYWRMGFVEKFTLPLSCLIFIFLAFSLGTHARRAGQSLGFAMGLGITVIYWGLLILGRTALVRTDYPPPLTGWIPNLTALAGGLFYYFKRQKR